jgi:hypothetical protein
MGEGVEPSRRLQERIDAALREDPADFAQTTFSDYLPDRARDTLVQRMTEAASVGGVRGVAAALDAFDRLSEHEDRRRLQSALMIFLTHHPTAAALGLRVPSIAERSPWSVLPSKREP